MLTSKWLKSTKASKEKYSNTLYSKNTNTLYSKISTRHQQLVKKKLNIYQTEWLGIPALPGLMGKFLHKYSSFLLFVLCSLSPKNIKSIYSVKLKLGICFRDKSRGWRLRKLDIWGVPAESRGGTVERVRRLWCGCYRNG